MRDQIFEASEGLAVTDSTAITQAKEAGSSVHLSWGAWFVILIFACAVAAVATQVIKKKEEGKGSGAVGGVKK
jgi:cytochrome b561